MSEASSPHRNLPEENTEALEIAHGLVEQRYPSVPSYEMKLAYALLSLEEQLEAERSKVEVLQHIVDGYPNLKEQLESAQERLARYDAPDCPHSENEPPEHNTGIRKDEQ